jgi:RNA polymerase sigma-70 factor (ECF subfamily)
MTARRASGPMGGLRSHLRVIDGGAVVTDAEVARRLQALDPAAPALLMDRFGALVDRVLRRILGDSTDHDDRVQETFLEVLRTVRALRDPEAFKAWVTTIAVRVARGELRRRKVRRIFTLWQSPELPEVAHDDDHPGREELRAVFRILDGLPTEDRIAFSLRFLHGEELTEVARLAGCSLATAKRRIARAEAEFRARAANIPALAARLHARPEAPT